MKSLENIPASVRQRLLNRAKNDKRPFNELLQYYAMERFLYRLSQSAHADRFILKGALTLRAWRSPEFRPTMDIDMLGKTSNEEASIVAQIREVMAVDGRGHLYHINSLEFPGGHLPQVEDANLGGTEEYPVFMAVAEKVGFDRRGNKLYKRTPDGEEIIEEKEYTERIRIGGRMVERTLTRREKVEDNDLPVIAEKYREFLKEHDR